MPGDPISLPATPPSSAERGAWRHVSGTWRALFGGIAEHGVSVEWHDFRLDCDLDWSRSFHPGCLEICLNFSGAARLQDGAAERALAPSQVAAYTTRRDSPRAVRGAETLHRFLTIELTPAFLATQCAGRLELLKAPLRRFVEQGAESPPFLEIHPLSTPLLAMRSALLEPPVQQAARGAWFQGKVLEILALTVFREDESGVLFCERHKRHNRDRVARVRYLLERDLENPPSLEMLSQDVECSTFHLSRIFAAETGMSMPKFLRTRRIERAAELLRSGKTSVTDAAFAVGYSSLSAFNKAFVEQMGCCPGLYPLVKISGRAAKNDSR